MKIARRLQRLFALKGHEFVAESFRELLNREPTPSEFRSFDMRLVADMFKSSIIADILLTEESMILLIPKPDSFGIEHVAPLLDSGINGNKFSTEWQDDSKELGPLSGVFGTTVQWLSTYIEDPSDISQHYIKFEAEVPIYSEPKGFDSLVSERFHRHLFNNPLNEQFIAIIPGGRIFGEDGVVISPDHFILWDLSPDLGNAISDHSILRRNTFPPVAQTSEVLAVLTSSISFSYYHWLFEVLARMDLLRRSGIEIDRFVVNRKGNIPFQNETLVALGIPNEKIIDCSEVTHIQAARLVVPSFAAYTGHVPKWACDFLREELLLNRNIERLEGYERIYISRADAMYRRIVNEMELINFLEGYGFKSIVLGSLTATQQIQIFASAQFVMGPHGAGMTNLIFCNYGTKVIEIFTPGFLNPTFWVPSIHMCLDYYYMIGGSSKGLIDGWDGTDDIVVDIGELTKILKFAGITKTEDAEQTLSTQNGTFKAKKLGMTTILQDMLRKEDCEFITEVYRNLLGRDPERKELEYYVNLVRSGIEKMAIISEILQSEEAVHLYHYG